MYDKIMAVDGEPKKEIQKLHLAEALIKALPFVCIVLCLDQTLDVQSISKQLARGVSPFDLK
jgi:hypothetical protein